MKHLIKTISPIWIFLFMFQCIILGWAIMSNTIFFSFKTDILGVFISFVTFSLPFFMIQSLITQKFHLRKIGFICWLIFHGFLISYFLTAKNGFDFSIIADNFSSAFSREATIVIIKGLHIEAIIFVLIFIGFIFFKKGFKRDFFTQKLSYKKVVMGHISIAIYGGLLVSNLQAPFDEAFNFLKSIHYYYSNPTNMALKPQEYPFIKTSLKISQKQNSTKKTKPTIFLILVESFNGTLIQKKSPEGFYYTPFFNKLIKKGVYIPNFYGNSVQTAKGHFSTFFSFIPSMRGVEYTKYPHLSLQGFPEILKQNGYQTLFFQSYKTENFDNTKTTMLKHGFNQFDTFQDIPKSESKNRNHWGVEDRVFYQHVFEKLDSNIQKNDPHFIVLATIYTHNPFEVPKHRRKHYKNPKSILESYANAIALADQDFEVFFTELNKHPEFKDSIVIITGDHSWPLAKKSSGRNEIGFSEASFRIPFLILWPGTLQPQIQPEPASQLDIGPTILDLAGIQPVKHHIQGQSIFLERPIERPIPLIQPYDGLCMGVITYPYHYVKRLKTSAEFLYDLSQDPNETTNIFEHVPDTKKETLRKMLIPIYKSQAAIQQNQVWL